jgi:hypothetical protein
MNDKSAIAYLAQLDTLRDHIANLAGCADELADASPDTVNWADVVGITHVNRLLCEVVQLLAGEGE